MAEKFSDDDGLSDLINHIFTRQQNLMSLIEEYIQDSELRWKQYKKALESMRKGTVEGAILPESEAMEIFKQT